MECYVCGQPAVGQCKKCLRFYCKQHGDVLCEACASKSEETAQVSTPSPATPIVVVEREPSFTKTVAKTGCLIAGATLAPYLWPIIAFVLLALVVVGVYSFSQAKQYFEMRSRMASDENYARLVRVVERLSPESYQRRWVLLVYDEGLRDMTTLLNGKPDQTAFEYKIKTIKSISKCDWTYPMIGDSGVCLSEYALWLPYETVMQKAGIIDRRSFDETKLRTLLLQNGCRASLVDEFIALYQEYRGKNLPDWAR
jgi:hypothetical protein